VDLPRARLVEACSSGDWPKWAVCARTELMSDKAKDTLRWVTLLCGVLGLLLLPAVLVFADTATFARLWDHLPVWLKGLLIFVMLVLLGCYGYWEIAAGLKAVYKDDSHDAKK